MPAETPAEVTIPSDDHARVALNLNRRSRATRGGRDPPNGSSPAGPSAIRSSRAAAHRCTPTSPATARGGLTDPCRASARRQERRVPKPPGTTRMSIGGASAQEYMRDHFQAADRRDGVRLRATVKVSNGALSSLRRESAPGTRRVRENTSNGPAKSSTSTSSNRGSRRSAASQLFCYCRLRAAVPTSAWDSEPTTCADSRRFSMVDRAVRASRAVNACGTSVVRVGAGGVPGVR